MPKLHSSSNKKLSLTGHTNVDIALQRHAEIESHARNVANTVKTFLAKVREQADASSQVTQAMRTYYAGSGGEAKVRVFESAHEKVDKQIPDELMTIAQEHIMRRLDAYMNELADVQKEIKTFHDRQHTFQHYSKKVHKLDEEHSKREREGKVEKPKQIEKLTRNRKKLVDSRDARDQMIGSLLNKLEYFFQTRISTMDPILNHLFQFQQAFYTNCGNALQVDLPETLETNSYDARNTTSPLSAQRPDPVQTTSSFDAHGNRRFSAEPSPPGSYRSSMGSEASSPYSTPSYSPGPIPSAAGKTMPPRPQSSRPAPPPPPPPSATQRSAYADSGLDAAYPAHQRTATNDNWFTV